MTSNTIRNKEAETAAKRQKEDQRKGRSLEKSEKFRNFGSGFGGFAKGAGDMGKLAALFGAANDPSWYFADPELARTVGNLSFANPLGNSMDSPCSGSTKVSKTLPGIAVYKFLPTLGGDGNNGAAPSPADVAARNVYAYIRFKNSGHANYDAPDYMMYLLSLDSMLMQYSELVRLYGTLNWVSPLNRYTQKAMVEALGFNYSDVITQMNDIRAYALLLRQRLSAFYLPKTLTYYQRHIWLSANIFKDDEVTKSQFHLFRPLYLYYYDEENSRLKSILHDSGTLKTFADFRTQCELIFKYILESESIGIMSGDTLKAYGDAGVLVLPSIDEDHAITPVYSAEVLEQIQNATVFMNPNAVTGWSLSCDIEQDAATGQIWQGIRRGNGTWGPLITKNTAEVEPHMPYAIYSQRYLIAEDDNPTPERVMTMTRLTATAVRVNDTEAVFGWIINNSGSEVIIGAYIHRLNDVDSPHLLWDGVVISSLPNIYKAILATRFEYFPYIRVLGTLISQTANTSNVPTTETFNCTNVTVVNAYDVQKFHAIALASMFGLPYHGETGSLTK